MTLKRAGFILLAIVLGLAPLAATGSGLPAQNPYLVGGTPVKGTCSATVTTNCVPLANSLATPGVLPKVSPAGALAESAVSDNGTDTVTVAGRNVVVAPGYGTTVLANGNFATDTVWVKGIGWTISGNAAHSDGSGAFADVSQAGVLVPGHTYITVFTVSSVSGGSVLLQLGVSAFGAAHGVPGTFTETITADGTNFYILAVGPTFTGAVTNVSVRDVNPGILSAQPGGTVPAWYKYSLIAIANGVNGCAHGTGCWQVNGVLGANKAAGFTQDVVLFQLPAKGKVTDWTMQTVAACTGATTASSGLGTAANNVLFRTQSYDIAAAPGATNIVEGPTAGAGAGTSAAINIVASLITTVANVDQLVAGCAVDYEVLWAVKP
jgi:hypothetical protein